MRNPIPNGYKVFFHDLLFKNKRQKLLSLNFAFLIWIVATVFLKKNVTEMVLPVILTYTETPETFIIKSPLPGKVNTHLFIRGSDNLNRSDFTINVDLNRIRSGNNHINLKEQNHNFPKNTEFFSIDPSFINIIAEEAAEKWVPVKLNYSGSLKDGYELGEIAVSPNSIKIKGPKSLIDTIQQVETGIVDLQNEDKNFSRVTTPILPEYFKLISENDINLSVTGTVDEIIIKQNFSNIPIELFGKRYKTYFRPRTINVTVMGSQRGIKAIETDKLKVYVDVSNVNPGSYRPDEIILALPDAVTLEKFFPPIKVRITNQKIILP